MKAPQIPVNEAERMNALRDPVCLRSTIIPRLIVLRGWQHAFSGCRWR